MEAAKAAAALAAHQSAITSKWSKTSGMAHVQAEADQVAQEAAAAHEAMIAQAVAVARYEMKQENAAAMAAAMKEASASGGSDGGGGSMLAIMAARTEGQAVAEMLVASLLEAEAEMEHLWQQKALVDEELADMQRPVWPHTGAPMRPLLTTKAPKLGHQRHDASISQSLQSSSVNSTIFATHPFPRPTARQLKTLNTALEHAQPFLIDSASTFDTYGATSRMSRSQSAATLGAAAARPQPREGTKVTIAADMAPHLPVVPSAPSSFIDSNPTAAAVSSARPSYTTTQTQISTAKSMPSLVPSTPVIVKPSAREPQASHRAVLPTVPLRHLPVGREASQGGVSAAFSSLGRSLKEVIFERPRMKEDWRRP